MTCIISIFSTVMLYFFICRIITGISYGNASHVPDTLLSALNQLFELAATFRQKVEICCKINFNSVFCVTMTLNRGWNEWAFCLTALSSCLLVLLFWPPLLCCTIIVHTRRRWRQSCMIDRREWGNEIIAARKATMISQTCRSKNWFKDHWLVKYV